MIPRILEPEVMDSAEEARDYDSMDHRAVNERFADDFLDAAPPLIEASRILDVGTGTALIPIEIAKRLPLARITAIDLAEEMLTLGRRNVSQSGLANRIELRRADAKELAGQATAFDAVISNSIVHHIPEPLAVFREMKRACRVGGLLFVRDLLRPQSLGELRNLVSVYGQGSNDHQRRLFADSLHAALTLDEVAELLEQMDLPADAVRQTSDRHWTVSCVVRIA